MSFVDVQLDPAVKARFLALMAQDAALAHQALDSAVRKTGTWTRNESLRRMSGTVGITQANLKKGRRVSVRASGTGVFDTGSDTVFSNSFRLSSGAKGGRTQSSVWIGTDDVKAIYLKAKATQTRQGVVQGGELYEHAFLAIMRSGHLGIFERKGAERLPIFEVGKPVDATAIFSDIQRVVSDHLSQTLDHELSYYFDIRSAA